MSRDMITDEVRADPDRLYAAAVAIVMAEDKPSLSLLQRRLIIGYNRACYLIDRMEEAGLITAANSAGLRKVIRAGA